MADKRNLTFGLQFGLADAISQIEKAEESIDDMTHGMILAEQESDELGTRIGRGANEIENGFRSAGARIEEAGAKISATSGDAERDFRKIGSSAESMGAAVIRSADDAMQATNSIGTTIKAGMDARHSFLCSLRNIFFTIRKISRII